LFVWIGREKELRDKEKSLSLYLHVKSEVENCIKYLKEKREEDPYRSILPRLLYQATHGPNAEIPTFEPWDVHFLSTIRDLEFWNCLYYCSHIIHFTKLSVENPLSK
jgi:hypothetical protein